MAWFGTAGTSDRRARRRGFLFVVAVVLLSQAAALTVKDWGAAASPAGTETYLAGEIAGPRSVSQTLRIDSPDVNGITVQARSFSGQPVAGAVVFELHAVDYTERALFRTTVPAERALAPGGYTVAFPPVREVPSTLRLTVSMPEAPSGRGIGLVANYQERYAGGALSIGGREQWGDLVFRTTLAEHRVAHNLRYLVRGGGSGAGPLWVAVTSLVGFDLAFLALVALLLPRSSVPLT